jgi:GNAT superfamily N-acetyltransferase
MTDVSAAWVARAVEDNEAEFLLALGRAGGGRERDDAEITWVIGGSPIAYHNCVVRADLEPERADAAINESQNLMRTSGVAGSWHVGPSMRPTDVGTRLEAHGFEGGPEPGMAADLRALPDVEAPTDVRISRVVTDTGLDAYEQVLSLGFGEGPPEAAWVREMYARIGVGDDVPWRHYVGLSGGDPVACASVFLAGGVAGLYFVCTVPDARRRGIGAAISREALAGTLELGFDVGVLGSSPMGQPMYERLGFREVCAVNVYEWSPFTLPTTEPM